MSEDRGQVITLGFALATVLKLSPLPMWHCARADVKCEWSTVHNGCMYVKHYAGYVLWDTYMVTVRLSKHSFKLPCARHCAKWRKYAVPQKNQLGTEQTRGLLHLRGFSWETVKRESWQGGFSHIVTVYSSSIRIIIQCGQASCRNLATLKGGEGKEEEEEFPSCCLSGHSTHMSASPLRPLSSQE